MIPVDANVAVRPIAIPGLCSGAGPTTARLLPPADRPRDAAQRRDLRHDRPRRSSQGDDFGPVTVPAGHLFLMGDNRDRSADSRFPRLGRTASAGRCRGRISAAAPSSSPSRSTARPSGEPAELVRGAARAAAPGKSLAGNRTSRWPEDRRPSSRMSSGPARRNSAIPLVRREMQQGRRLVRAGACSSSASSSSPSRCC